LRRRIGVVTILHQEQFLLIVKQARPYVSNNLEINTIIKNLKKRAAI
jgi:hypothetical protein